MKKTVKEEIEKIIYDDDGKMPCPETMDKIMSLFFQTIRELAKEIEELKKDPSDFPLDSEMANYTLSRNQILDETIEILEKWEEGR